MPETLWPTAAPHHGSPVPLESTLEAEFSASQLRELAKWLDVKLKGTSKSGYIDQVAEALKLRAEGADGTDAAVNAAGAEATPGVAMNASGEAILTGLNDEQADFIRRMLTARDADSPLPRSVAYMVWAKQFGSSANQKLAEVIESLRRRALLFPTITYYTTSFRDVYYQWLPLGRKVPVMKWRVEAKTTTDDGRPTTAGSVVVGRRSSVVNFLDAFESFLTTVLQAGVALRSPLKPHAKARQTHWLQQWEHDADDAERVLNSRPGWVPDPSVGIEVPVLSPFTPKGATLIETQTGLTESQCELILAIACALQLIQQPGPDQIALANMGAIEEWFGLSNEMKLRRAWTAWCEHIMAGLEIRGAMQIQRAAKVAEPFQVMRAIGARNLTPPQMAAEWCALRRYMTRVLIGVPAGKWLDWTTLRRQLFDFYADCAWTTTSRTEWWFAMNGRGKAETQRFEDWADTIGLVLECILRDSLAEFGAVETQIDDAGQLVTFRVTAVGEWLIGQSSNALPEGAQPTERQAEAIKWLDEVSLRVPPAPDRAELVSFVRQIADRGDQPFVFVFTAASIEQALSRGITLDEVTQRFKQAKLSLSKALTAQFKLIARRHGRVRVYPALAVLELADDLAVRELSLNTSLKQHIVYQISPRAVVLRAEAVDTLLEEMQEKGYTPGERGGEQSSK